MRTIQGFPLSFNIYAANEEEVEECRKAIISFIAEHASQGRAVTAKKVTGAIRDWEKSSLVRARIIQYFKS